MSLSLDKSADKACVVLNSGGEQVAGVQCDLTWNPSCVSLEGKCAANLTHGKTLNQARRGDSGMRAILLALDNLDPIPDGELFCCTFKTLKCDGGCCAINIENALGSTPQGGALRPSTSRFAGLPSGSVSNVPGGQPAGGSTGTTDGSNVVFGGGPAAAAPAGQVMAGGGGPAAGAPSGASLPGAASAPGAASVAGATGAAPGSAAAPDAPAGSSVPAAAGTPAGAVPAIGGTPAAAAPGVGSGGPALLPGSPSAPAGVATAAATAAVTAAAGTPPAAAAAATQPAAPTQPRAAATATMKRAATPTERVEDESGWGCQVDGTRSVGVWPLALLGCALLALRWRRAKG
jgi:hypothetical protein